MGFNVDIVALGQKVIQAQAVAVVEVDIVDVIPHPRAHHLGAGDLPAPEVV